MKTENDPEWQAAIDAEGYSADVIRRAIQTICTYADEVKRWGGPIDGDWIEFSLAAALDTALPQRLDQREAGYRTRNGPPDRNVKGALRTAVFERDAYRCVFCGSHTALQVDHIHPVSKGGQSVIENLQTLCKPCNREKGAKVL